MRKFIIFLVRRRLGLKKGQYFQFNNQRSKRDVYYFTVDKVMKIENGFIRESSVSLNWLLNDECYINKF